MSDKPEFSLKDAANSASNAGRSYVWKIEKVVHGPGDEKRRPQVTYHASDMYIEAQSRNSGFRGEVSIVSW